jgi:general secretion pathway protein A
MYLRFYKLKEFPFAISCDERYFFESPIHTEALANMMYAVQQRKGMVLVTGEVGAGKTFVGNVLAGRLGTGCLTITIQNPPQSGKQLLRSLAIGAGMNVRPGADKSLLLEGLEEHLRRMQARGRLVALLIDEAQDLTPAALEEVRLLWNWEQNGQRLVQIVLIGLPDLRQRLMEPRWEPVRQRVVLSYHLGHLAAKDTAAYVMHRIRVAAEDGACEDLFSPEALTAVHESTGGIPRLINVLCDNALLIGYSRESQKIEKDIVLGVLRDMTCWGLRTPIAPSAAAPTPGG